MVALAGSYTLTDGTKIEGDPVSENENGVVFHTPEGADLERIAYEKFSQDSIRALLAGARTAREKSFIEPYLEELPQERAQRKELIVKPIQPPPRPTAHLGLMALFGSPVGLTILLILYGANLLAAYEVAVYRGQPVSTVCGLAAIPFFGVLSPIIFIAIPGRRVSIEGFEEAQTRFQATPPPAPDTGVLPDPGAAPGVGGRPVVAAPGLRIASQPAGPAPQENAPALPQPIVFQRSEFSFNRRFFETKLAGFFRVVPAEAEKDMVVYIRSGRGDFTGRRITRVTPTELYLQVFHDNATADEMIPFVEVLEVQIRHKDTL
jgi:hypothetical protein